MDADPTNAIALGAALSLTSAGIAATGGMGAGVPVQRGPTGRHGPSPAPYGGATEVVRGPSPTSSRGYPSQPYMPAAPLLGPPTPRESGTGSMSARAAVPPGRPMGYPDRPDVTPEDVDFDYEDRPARRPAALVSIGGAAAAVAVIGIVFLFPGTDPVTADAGRFSLSPAGGPAPASTTSEEPEPTTTEATDEPVERTTRPAPTLVLPTTEAAPTTPPPATTTPPPAQSTAPQPPPDDDDPPDDDEPPPDDDDPPPSSTQPPGATTQVGASAPQ